MGSQGSINYNEITQNPSRIPISRFLLLSCGFSRADRALRDRGMKTPL